MEKFEGYDEMRANRSTSRNRQLKAGGYVLNIMNVKKTTSKAGSSMFEISFDIFEGEFANFYAEKYRKNTSPSRKWGGKYYMVLPDKGNQTQAAYEKRLRTFTEFMADIEESNEGYTWNWREESLQGKKVGGIFGREQFQGNDNALHFSTKLFWFASVETIRKGDFSVPEDRLLDLAPADDFIPMPAGEPDDLPF